MPTQTISRCGGTTGGTALYETLIAANVKAMYKMDEVSGTTAADSSGNGYDATTYAGRTAPTWGQAAGPPGTTTARFTQSGFTQGLRNAAFPSLLTNWTILGWFMQQSDVFCYAAGQGTAVGFNSPGFAVGFNSTHDAPARRAWVYVGSGAGVPTAVLGDNELPVNNWHMLAGTRSGTTVTLYVDGAAQSTPGTPAYAATTGTFLGQNNGTQGMTGLESWVCFFDAALTAAQIGAIYTAASL